MILALLRHGTSIGLHDAFTAWSGNPAIVLPLAATAALYAAGYRRILDATARRRTPAAQARTRQAWCFAAGLFVLTLALVSPLHAFSEQLFSVHMVQHELLMTVAAPLLVMGQPAIPSLWAMPMRWRRAAGGALRTRMLKTTWHALVHPFVASLVYGVVLWTWHLPSLFQLGLTSEPLHALQHVSFLLASLLFWQAMLMPHRASRRGGAVLYLFATAVHTSVLGALITFDSTLWYPLYARRAAALGVAALADQQWAGLIMWVPGSVPYLVAALGMVVLWLRDSGTHRWTIPVPSLESH